MKDLSGELKKDKQKDMKSSAQKIEINKYIPIKKDVKLVQAWIDEDVEYNFQQCRKKSGLSHREVLEGLIRAWVESQGK